MDPFTLALILAAPFAVRWSPPLLKYLKEQEAKRAEERRAAKAEKQALKAAQAAVKANQRGARFERARRQYTENQRLAKLLPDSERQSALAYADTIWRQNLAEIMRAE